MSEKDLVLSRIRQVAHRLGAHSRVTGALVGTSLTAVCCCILALTAILTPIPHVSWICAGFLLLGAIAGTILAPRFTLRQAAIHADLAAGTDEILSSSLEADPHNRFGAAILSQAVAIVQKTPASRLASGPKGRMPWSLLAPLGALGLLLVLPGLPAPAAERRGADIAAQKLRRLEQRAREMKNLSVEIESKELATLAQEMKKLVTQVRQGKLDRKEALARLAKLQEDARGIRKDLKTQKKSLAELGKNSETKSMADAISQGRMEKAQKAAQKLAGKLSEGKLDGSAKSELQKSLSKMAEDAKGSNGALAEAANRASDALGSGNAKEFGDQMSKLAESMKNAQGGSSSPGESGEFDDALSDLNDAEQDLSDRGSDRSSASSQHHCENCGRRKNPGGN